MNQQRRLKKELKNQYCFTQNLTPSAVERLRSGLYPGDSLVEAATLQVGMLRLDAVLYWCSGNYQLGYDLMVKDSEDSETWICYESLPDPVTYGGRKLEQEMFRVLDRAAAQFGLSYTQCAFPHLEGKEPKPR